jgi:hypothetical protein
LKIQKNPKIDFPYYTVMTAICQWLYNVQPLHEQPTLAIFFLRDLPKVYGPFSALCDHWQIATATARYANELEAES